MVIEKVGLEVFFESI